MKTKKKDEFLYLIGFHENIVSVVLMQTPNTLNTVLHNAKSLNKTAKTQRQTY